MEHCVGGERKKYGIGIRHVSSSIDSDLNLDYDTDLTLDAFPNP